MKGFFIIHVVGGDGLIGTSMKRNIDKGWRTRYLFVRRTDGREWRVPTTWKVFEKAEDFPPYPSISDSDLGVRMLWLQRRRNIPDCSMCNIFCPPTSLRRLVLHVPKVCCPISSLQCLTFLMTFLA